MRFKKIVQKIKEYKKFYYLHADDDDVRDDFEKGF